MQYLLLIYYSESEWNALEPAARDALIRGYADFTKALLDGGKLRGSDRLKPSSTATSVRVRDGKALVTDGPFAETREQLGGYYLIEAKDLDEALAWAARLPGSHHGTVEVRPVFVMPQAAP